MTATCAPVTCAEPAQDFRTQSSPFTTFVEPGPPEPGVRLRLGPNPPRRERLVLRMCLSDDCTSVRRIPLHLANGPIGEVIIEAGPTGRLLIADGDTIVTLLMRDMRS